MNYSMVLSANGIAKCNKLLNKRKTVKHCSEKSKCLVAMWLKKNLWSNGLSSLTKIWNSSFEYLSRKICYTRNVFFLILLLCLKFKRSNSQSISFLAEIVDIGFWFTRSFLIKLNFSCSSKFFSDSCKTFSCFKNFFLSVEKTSALKSRTLWFSTKKKAVGVVF